MDGFCLVNRNRALFYILQVDGGLFRPLIYT